MNLTQIETVAHSHLNPDSRIFDFLNGQLRKGSGFSICDEYPSLFGDFPGGYSLVARVNALMAGHVGVLAREFTAPALRMKIGLIGSVVTAPEYRHHGVASALMQRAILDLKSRGCLVTMLWADDPSFYEPFEFYRAGREIDFRFIPGSLPSEAAEPTLFDEKKHTNLVWRLYQKHTLKLDRSLEEQKALVRIPRAQIFLSIRKNEVTSYLVIHKGMDFTDYIHEWGGDLCEVQRNIAGTQKFHFGNRPLTLIAPATYDLSLIRAIATEEVKGVVGLMRVLDKTLLLKLYSSYLRSQGVIHQVKSDRFVFGKEEYAISTSREILSLVFGDAGEPKNLKLPFFLWGFDSI